MDSGAVPEGQCIFVLCQFTFFHFQSIALFNALCIRDHSNPLHWGRYVLSSVFRLYVFCYPRPPLERTPMNQLDDDRTDRGRRRTRDGLRTDHGRRRRKTTARGRTTGGQTEDDDGTDGPMTTGWTTDRHGSIYIYLYTTIYHG